MPRQNIHDILAFLAVAQDRSFTRAAARLGTSQSALSHAVRGLEARMGVRLLTRTTRSVSVTEAGERLVQNVGPRLAEIEGELAAVRELGERPVGTIRITAIDHVIDHVLVPRLAGLMAQHPDLRIEFSADYRLIDVAAERFDIGVRYGDQVQQDMVAVRLTNGEPMAIVGSPQYFKGRMPPRTMRDLLLHNCIALRLTSGRLYAWELMEDGRPFEVKVNGQTVCNGAYQMLRAALAGLGLAFLPVSLVQPYLDRGDLHSVLAHACPSFPGLHAYYPSQRNASLAFRLVIEAIRYKA